MANHRRSIRLKGYDYSLDGAYFVTVCVKNHDRMFGYVKQGRMTLNDFGKIADECWREIPTHFKRVSLDQYIVMPNHIHGIINIGIDVFPCRGAACCAPTFTNIAPGSLPAIVRSYKSAVTKCIHRVRPALCVNIWQRNYFERIIRNESELNKIRQYIVENPLSWDVDSENITASIDTKIGYHKL